MNDFLDRLPLDPRLKKILPYLISIALLLIVFIGSYIAAGATNPTAAETTSQTDALGLMQPSSSFDITLDVILKIVFVFGLIYLVFAILKWWQKKQPGMTQKRLQIVETVRPSPRQTFYLVKVDGQEFLVGATDQSMNLISEIEVNDEELVETDSRDTLTVDETNSFHNMMQKTIQQTTHLFQPQKMEEPANAATSQKQVIK